MIGIYGGNTKPAEFNEFSADTISGIKEMADVGLFSVKFNKYIAIRLAAVMCDSPARSSVRYTANHNGCVASNPSDFLRKCRALDFVSTWKASECRLFLPYLGPVILQKALPQPLYVNFRRLALSICLLAHPKLHNTVEESARIDLQNFLKEYEWCYGSETLVYNVHSLAHLPNDVRAHGPLDSFSAFPFESYMRQIKDSVYSGFAVAKQPAQRCAENMYLYDRLQLTCLTDTTSITSFKSDNVVVVNGKPGLVTDIKEDGLPKFRFFTDPRNYFEDPFPSSDIGIFMCSVVIHDHTWISLKDTDCKCIAINFINNLVIIPLLHALM
ncbi:unnamed protein product [Schistosoma mattheei]|uniref:Uncharacterized protein n=1 Tax=Schistosoma mattheei TaxID=31246 RepID=A0A183PWZ2_9TREM|nr:unnamed protein product [Schistosoma mattheei]